MILTTDDLGICKSYIANKAKYDEMCHTDGSIRLHWEYLINALQKLGSEELIKRSLETQRHLRETGVTYNIHDDIQNQFNPWQLDPIPFIIDSKEWSKIETALIQRADLLSQILKDLYGPRKLIQYGLIPAELVFAHDGFLRACNGINSANANLLQFYAADLARNSDGQFIVLGDRTQAPAGAGYALENRTIMRRVLPSLFRDSQVHRLALFFRSIRNEISTISSSADQARSVLLTPGANAETYFEHSYLANYLGYALVQGSDLTSRSGKIWLKSLDGLQPVDSIIRHVDDFQCDPLEFRQDSSEGIPGLMEAVRRGNVTMMNSIGSSILENPALQSFLPGICRHLFGQELHLPGIKTWWCGQEKSFDYVMEKFDQLIIKPIAKQQGISSIMPSDLDQLQKQNLINKIKNKPHLYAAQEKINYSSTPTLAENKLQPRTTLLRTFLSARSGSYIVMPGGLTRIFPEQGKWGKNSTSKQRIISKDTWVLASEPERQISLWSSQPKPDINSDYAGIGSLPSRAADNLFWLGRLAERSEDFIRLFRSIGNKLDDVSEYHDSVDKTSVQILLKALNSLTLYDNNFELFTTTDNSNNAIEKNLIQLIFEQKNTGTLVNILNGMLNSAYRVRDLLSQDTWRVINGIESTLKKWNKIPPGDLLETVDELDVLISSLAAFSGLLLESTTREQGWLFLTIGRRMERAQWLIGLVKEVFAQPQDEYIEQILLESLLVGNESLMTYRRRYRSTMEMKLAMELILLDQTNPRSLNYQLLRLQRAINSLPQPTRQIELNQQQRLILEANSLLQLSDLNLLCQVDQTTGRRELLEDLLTKTSNILNRLSLLITEIYFNHSVAPQQLINFSEPE